MKLNSLFFMLLLLAACNGPESENATSSAAETNYSLPYELRMTLTHDPNAFTQGLVYHNGKIIEGTGGDSSWVAEYDIASGSYQKKVVLDKTYFGEGITVLNDKLYQLSWKNKVGFVYEAGTYEKIGEFAYDFEGWGITHNGEQLIISDGTDKLHYFDPATLREVSSKSVTLNNRPLTKLNELEYIDGFIYANEWETNFIHKIDPATAEVVNTFDLSPLVREVKKLNPQADVLNGIAYNPQTKEVYVTGKRWPRLYVIRFVE